MFDLGEIWAAIKLDDSHYMNKLKGVDSESKTIFNKIKGYALKAFAAIGGTIFLKSVITEFNNAEFASKMYGSALRANGNEVRQNTIIAKKFSEEMQQLTKHEDDAVLAAMRHGLSLGVLPSQIENVTKAAIGLGERYGFDLPQAMTLLVRAQNGHTEQLVRMGIQLDTTKSKAQQFQQLMAIGAGSFAMATDAAKSNQGAMEQLHNTLADTKEVVGEALAPTFTSLNQTIRELLLTFNSWDKTTIAAIVRTIALVAGIRLLMGVVSGIRALYAGKNLLVAANTALMASNTQATIANTAANIANSASQKGIAGAAAVRGGFLGVNAIAGTMAASGGMTGVAGSILGSSMGTIGAYGGIAAAIGIPALIAGTAVAGYGIGKLAADLTGLTPVLERTFGSWFHGLDAIEARSAGLDKQLLELNKKRQEEKDAIIAEQKALIEKTKAEKDYNKKIADANFEVDYDKADAKTKAKMSGDKFGQLMADFLNAPGTTPEELEKKAAMYDKALEMEKRYNQALAEIDKEREEIIKKALDESKKASSRKLNRLEAGLRSDGKFDMSDEIRLAGEKVIEQEKYVQKLRLELQKASDDKQIEMLSDTINTELVELGKLREDAKKAAENPEKKYASSMSSYASDIYGDKEMSASDKAKAILEQSSAENKALYDRIAKETFTSHSGSSKQAQSEISLGKFVKALERQAKLAERKEELNTLKEIREAIKNNPGGVSLTLPDKV